MTEEELIQLRLDVAEVLGYTLESFEEEYWSKDDRGHVKARTIYQLKLKETVVAESVLRDKVWKITHDYPRDLNACVKALDATGEHWEVITSWVSSDGKYTVSIGDLIKAHGSTPAIAACFALLAWYKRCEK